MSSISPTQARRSVDEATVAPRSSERLRFLVLSEYLPQGEQDVVGSFQRMDMFMEAIAGVAELDLLFFSRRRRKTEQGPAVIRKRLGEKWGAEVELTICPPWEGNGNPLRSWRRKARCLSGGAISYYPEAISFRTAGMEQVEAVRRRLARRPDAVFAHTLGAMAPLTLAASMPRAPSLPPVFFDLNDVEDGKVRREIRAGGARRAAVGRYVTAGLLGRSIQRAVRLARRTYVCSDDDRNRLRRRVPGSVIRTVPNAVRIPDRSPLAPTPVLTFLGSHWYDPNVQAARYLIHEILPRVRRSVPDAQLVIAGPGSERIPESGSPPPGVIITGFVEDLDELYGCTRVVCCPVELGGGTRIKIVEAAACGKPIVATRFGAHGLQLVNERDLLLRETPASFAEACVTLLKDDELCRRLGSSARSAAIRDYDRRSVVLDTRADIATALADRTAGQALAYA